jgi:predicted LPLAT superfamily acyltransferase
VLHLTAGYLLLFAPASRRASSNYLRRALGRPPHWRDLYRHFFTFAATIHDRVYLVNRRFEIFDVEVHGEDALRRLLAGGKGVFLMGAHLGSFEVIRAIGEKRIIMSWYVPGYAKDHRISGYQSEAAGYHRPGAC